MTGRYLLGLDIGTSGCKSIIIDDTGKIIKSVINEYSLSTPKAGWAEQNPEHWWQAVVLGIKQLLGENSINSKDIAGVGLSGQMHGLVALDKRGSVLRPAILWNDQRSEQQCREITDRAGGVEALLKLTNNRMLPGYTGSKLLWLKENEPSVFEKMSLFLNPKDYIRYRLTGEKVTEVSDASGTGLFDVKRRVWSKELLSILDIPSGIIPACYESTEISGRINKETADLTGLQEGLSVAGGGGDSVIQTTGMGLIKTGIIGTTIGTAGIVAMGMERFFQNHEGLLQVFCNNTSSSWHAMGVTLNAGGAYRWFRDTFAEGEKLKALETGKDVYTIMEETAAGAKAGSESLLFLPYLIGERCPYIDTSARGAFIGLSLQHTRSDITRSVMEGVVYSLKDVYELISMMGSSISEIRTSGGGSISPLWRQIQADVFQCPVTTVSGSGEGGAFGSALIAGVGVGIWSSVDEALGILKKETETFPDKSKKSLYEDLYSIYHSLYEVLQPVYRELAKRR